MASESLTGKTRFRSRSDGFALILQVEVKKVDIHGYRTEFWRDAVIEDLTATDSPIKLSTIVTSKGENQ